MQSCRVILSLLLCVSASAEQVTVAVASNFILPAEELVTTFEQSTGHSVAISAGSTGKLYAQIINGAPYDVFLAADAERPALLEASDAAVDGSRFTYATGALELWSANPALSDTDCRLLLDDLDNMRLAIANPLTAPYGAAARDFLTAAGLWNMVEDNLVYGENIAQTLHFVATGNASLGLIASSQAISDRVPAATCRWPVPAWMHAALDQQAVLLATAANNDEAGQFLDYLRSPEGRAIIKAHGYGVPD